VTVTLREHHLQWVTAAPLWRDAVGASRDDATTSEAAAIRRPALLRFGSDSFMEDLQRLLATDPPTLKDHRATAATRVGFRERPPDAPANWSPQPAFLKLYQPVHGHFNLVAASLVCRRAGLPDHPVDRGAHEIVGFVVRRLRGTTSSELAWAGKTWTVVADNARKALANGEQLLPLFPLGFADPEGHARTLFFGLIPTASGESFDAAAATAAPGLSLAPSDADAATLPDPRVAELQLRVIDPLTQLLATNPGDAPARRDAVRFLLLDTVDFLQAYLPDTWHAVASRATNATALQTKLEQNDLVSGWTWAEALRSAHVHAAEILAHAGTTPSIDLPHLSASDATSRAKTVAGWFALAFNTAEGARTKPPVPSASHPGPESAHVPKLDPSGAARYVLRCVYLRPDCGPLHDDVVSDASEEFRFAPFFDPDAPARAITIALPGNPTDLRSFNKNVRLLLSQQMQQSMNRASSLSSLTSGSVGSPGQVDVGLICAFSIPVITICALILLMIMVNLLNLVFWWLPFFRLCFPSVKAS
jgi:hypothetical protein